MGIRNKADWRPLAWLAMAAGLLAVEYTWSHLVFYLFWLNCYFAITAGVIAHNHNHCPIFAGKRWNGLLGHVLSFFYGYPTFVWVPTHNLNHHKHVNRAGDATITWRITDRHNLFVAVTYFFVSVYHQSFPIKAFIRKAKATNPQLHRRIQWQYVIWLSAWLFMLLVGINLHGLRRGAVLWGLSIGLPALCSVWVITFFNYEQHVHTDPWSKHNHSRNFTGSLLNYLLFNNGFHGVHHDQPALHWSKLPAAHGRIAAHIDPVLNQPSLPIYCVRQFLLAPIWHSLGTRQVGRAPYDARGSRTSLACDESELGEAGSNSEMAAEGRVPN
ncbi:MAG: fatty acid desaturase [Planctomycetes bacterium]|nr:fatty acid desaturase [Planctomycetota bacterium]